MRLAIFTDTYSPEVNGVVNTIISTSGLLLKKGYKIKIFAPEYNLQSINKLNGIAVKRIYSVPLPSYKDVRIGIPLLNLHMKSIKRFNPDIIHVHTPGTIGTLGIIYGKKYKKAIVGTYHTLLPDFTMYISISNLLGLDRLLAKIKYIRGTNQTNIKERSNRDTLIKRFVWYLTTKFYNNCNIVITPSNTIQQLLIKNGLSVPIALISDGIDFRRFSIKGNFSDKPCKLLHVGRVSYEKNIDILIRAMKHIVEKEKNTILTIIGDGPAMWSYKLLTKELNLEKNIIFKGHMNIEKLYKEYKEYDIFCTASTIETLGLVLLEAMASGLPIIGVDALAIPEIVHHEKNGYIVRPYDTQEMAKYMLVLLNNPALREKFGRKSLEEVKGHDIIESVEKLDSLYIDVAGIYRD